MRSSRTPRTESDGLRSQRSGAGGPGIRQKTGTISGLTYPRFSHTENTRLFGEVSISIFQFRAAGCAG